MQKNNVNEQIGKLISIGVFLTCIIVTPHYALDPINIPKMVVLAIMSGVTFGLLISQGFAQLKSGFILIHILLIGFLLTLFLSSTFSDGKFINEFYGVHGRNTGLLTYASFVILMYVAFFISNQRELKRFYKTLYIAGLVSAIYGLLQYLGIDPAGWDIYASPIVGFLGNSDFQSAFLAIFCSVVFTHAIVESRQRVLNLTIAFSTLIIVFLTHAKQGLIAFVIGSSISLLVVALKKNSKNFVYLYFVMLLSGIGLISIGALNSGPIGHLIYKSSLEARYFYWQAALRMFKDNLLFGVGLDSFGDYYARYRTPSAVAWNTQPTNAAHNVFLDYAANGGIFFLLLNLVVVIWVLVTFYKLVILKREFNLEFIVLFSGWVAFQAQSLISINQIGLAVWNWALSGLLIGFGEIKFNDENNYTKEKIRNSIGKKSVPTKSHLDAKSFIFGVMGFGIAMAVSLPSYVGSVKYWNFINSGDLKVIESAAYLWPQDEYKYWSVILTISGNASAIDENTSNPKPVDKQKQIDDLYISALRVNRDAISQFPNSVHLWRLYGKNPMNVPSEVKIAVQKVKELDPLNPTL